MKVEGKKQVTMDGELSDPSSPLGRVGFCVEAVYFG